MVVPRREKTPGACVGSAGDLHVHDATIGHLQPPVGGAALVRRCQAFGPYDILHGADDVKSGLLVGTDFRLAHSRRG